MLVLAVDTATAHVTTGLVTCPDDLAAPLETGRETATETATENGTESSRKNGTEAGTEAGSPRPSERRVSTSAAHLLSQLTAGPCRSVHDSRAHNEVLTPLIMECLAEGGYRPKDVGAVVTGIGPGPFTGLRVGMATAAAFGDALGVPAYGVVTLDALAYNAVAEGATGRIVVATDARRREVYWEICEVRDGFPVAVTGPSVSSPADVVRTLTNPETCTFVLASEIAPHFSTVTSDYHDAISNVRALVGAAVASEQWGGTPEPLQPLYLRRPDAVPPKEKPISPAIGEAAISAARAGGVQ